MNILFTGEPTTLLIKGEEPKVEDEEQNQNVDDEDETESKVEAILKHGFTELDRLASVVRDIDHDTSVVPRGA